MLLKTYCAIEFKDDSAIVVCLHNRLSGAVILAYASFALNDEGIAEIKRFIDKYNADRNNVFVSIPYRWAVTKFMDIPLPPGKSSVGQLMQFEVQRHIPFQIDDVSYDFSVLDKKDASCRVVFAAVQKQRIENIKNILEGLSLKPKNINISAFSLFNSLVLSGTKAGGWQDITGIKKRPDIFSRKGETTVSLFFEENEAILSVVRDTSCLLLKNFTYERLKDAEGISSVIKDTLSELSIQKAERIIISGRLSVFPDLPNSLKDKTGIETVVLSPLSQFFPKEKAEESQWLMPAIGACFSQEGLNINLLSAKPIKEGKSIGLLVTKLSLFLILFLAVGIVGGQIRNEKKRLSLIEDTLKKNETDVAYVEKLSKEIKASEKQKGFLLGLKDSDITLDVLLELSNILPADSWVTNLSYNKSKNTDDKTFSGEILLGGYAQSASTLISMLENSPLFEKVEFVGPVTKAKEKEGFRIKARVVMVKPSQKETQKAEDKKI
ncbi:MAG: pilus assembly protein PilM [Nitrospirae bacterium]|nr:pilus assembly protein PilM [Nitrospirota bacterium]